MTTALTPAIWLIVLLVGLPQLSETVYTPSLPEIAIALVASPTLVEYTLTIFLFGFALGMLLWGRLSDYYGRKPCALAGLMIFIIGSVGCYLASSIEMLMVSRFIQAIGGSGGSILGQAISRDAFRGPALGKIYSTIGSALTLFPALGPLIGGFIAQHYGWQNIFLVLSVFAFLLFIAVAWRLPETHAVAARIPQPLWLLTKRLAKDKKVVSLALIIGALNGISFSYFAEGSFYLIKLLGLTPTEYGLTFMATAASAMVGGIFSRFLHNKYSSVQILRLGIYIILMGASLSSMFVLNTLWFSLSSAFLITVIVIAQMIIMFGICMAMSNALALSLSDYTDCAGTASSLFGLFYYALIGFFTLGMGALHNGTLFPMPFYFLGISLFILILGRSLKI